MPQASRARRDDSAPRCATHPGGRRRRAASRSRGCHLARCARVPPPGQRARQPRYVPRPFRDNLDTPVPDTAQVPYLKKPQRGVCLQVDFSLTNRHFSCAFPPRRCRDLSRRFLRRREDPASPRSTDRPTAAALYPEPRADAFDPWKPKQATRTLRAVGPTSRETPPRVTTTRARSRAAAGACSGRRTRPWTARSMRRRSSPRLASGAPTGSGTAEARAAPPRRWPAPQTRARTRLKRR